MEKPSPTELAVHEAFLDELYERAVELVEDGELVDIVALVGDRVLPDSLRDQPAALVELAYDLVAAGRARLPRVPGYELLGELGRGGMGTVYLARQLAVDGRLVALKAMAMFAGLSRTARARFLGEVRALANLRHPNIVTIYDVIEEGPLIAYAMEWIDGENLGALIGRTVEGPWSMARELLPDLKEGLSYPAFVAHVGERIAEALAAVHAEGLLHRDVKPTNILLRRDGTPLLADFGLVRDEGGSLHTQTGAFIGTPAYAAPEQLRGDAGRMGPGADVYALGATLHHALARQPPFAGADALSVLGAIEAGRCTPFATAERSLPADLRTIVAAAMEPELEHRYPDAAALVEDLRRLRDSRPILAKPAGFTRRVARFARRHRPSLFAGLLGVFATLILMAVAAYWFIWLPREIDARQHEARLALLDTSFSEVITLSADMLRSGDGLPGNWEELLRSKQAPALDEARSAYAGALRLARGRERPRLLAEAATVDLASAARAGRPVPQFTVDEAPALVRELYSRGARGKLGSSAVQEDSTRNIDWAKWSGEELRHAGLYAFLCERIDLLESAWSRLEAMGASDALVDAARGQILLRQERPGASAYRLRGAVAAFPEAAFLATDLAESLFLLGELELAERWLEVAEPLEYQNPFSSAELLRARIAVSLGRTGEARARFSQLLTQHRHRKLREAYSDFLARQHDWAGLLWNEAQYAADHEHLPSVQCRFLRALGSWLLFGRGWCWIRAGVTPRVDASGGISLIDLLNQVEVSARLVAAAGTEGDGQETSDRRTLSSAFSSEGGERRGSGAGAELVPDPPTPSPRTTTGGTKMKMKRANLVAAAMISLGTASSAGEISSTFDVSAEGWLLPDGVLNHLPAGGYPGGYVSMTDTVPGRMYTYAPSKFLGDLSCFDGGALQVSVRLEESSSSNPIPYAEFGLVRLSNATAGLTAEVDLVSDTPPPTDWTSYAVGFDAATWGLSASEWALLLSDVSELRVDVEVQNGLDDRVGFDEFMILPAASPSAETVRLGTPSNPDAFKPGVSSGPVVGATWDPVIDHATFVPDSVSDFVVITGGPANIDLGPIGTLLCDVTSPLLIFGTAASPGAPFTLFVPSNCPLIGAEFCAQGGSIDPSLNARLTNALDVTVGTF